MKKSPQSLQQRDVVAWDEFYGEHVRELYGFVFRLVRGDPLAAADVFQDIWLDALSHIGQFDPNRGALRSWLFGIARRRIALYWRQRTACNTIEAAEPQDVAESVDGELLPNDVLEHLEQAAVVQASLLAMPSERRQVLSDKYVDGLSVDQIATKTGKSSKAVESLLSRAREQFRMSLHWYFADSRNESET